MTEYTERVERERNKQAAEKWGKGVRYIHANNGVIETKYNNNIRGRGVPFPASGENIVIKLGWGSICTKHHWKPAGRLLGFRYYRVGGLLAHGPAPQPPSQICLFALSPSPQPNLSFC